MPSPSSSNPYRSPLRDFIDNQLILSFSSAQEMENYVSSQSLGTIGTSMTVGTAPNDVITAGPSSQEEFTVQINHNISNEALNIDEGEPPQAEEQIMDQDIVKQSPTSFMTKLMQAVNNFSQVSHVSNGETEEIISCRNELAQLALDISATRAIISQEDHQFRTRRTDGNLRQNLNNLKTTYKDLSIELSSLIEAKKRNQKNSSCREERLLNRRIRATIAKVEEKNKNFANFRRDLEQACRIKKLKRELTDRIKRFTHLEVRLVELTSHAMEDVLNNNQKVWLDKLAV